MFGKKSNIKVLLEKKFGYIMFNEEDNVEIKCTPEFKETWTSLGFKVIKTTDRLQLVK